MAAQRANGGDLPILMEAARKGAVSAQVKLAFERQVRNRRAQRIRASFQLVAGGKT